jgi:hypothetical protein
MDAQAEGYDCAVLVDGEGNVAEGPNMNLAALLVRGGGGGGLPACPGGRGVRAFSGSEPCRAPRGPCT